MPVKPTPPWKKKNPRKAKAGSPAGSRKLTAAQKTSAKTRAKRAGRRYPNLVDNMWAASSGNAGKKKSPAPRKKKAARKKK